MTDSARVRAGWALWGKPPGTRDDYSVLACSPEPFSRSDFGTILTRFSAGTPATRSGGPGSLPWVTVSWVGVDDGLQIGIAIAKATDQVDGVGRPINQTSYFCVPYNDLAGSQVSYLSLYEAVRDLSLPAGDGMIPLTLPPLDVREAAGSVEEFGENTVVTAAALLLSGPVTIVQAEGSTLAERLRFLDAVACLLPYGFRAKFSAASWSDSSARHRIRLAFATRPREDAVSVAWREPGVIPVGHDVARNYLQHFRQLRGEGGIPGKVYSMPAVITHLATDQLARKFEQPMQAVESLCMINLPFRVLAAVQGGSVDPSDLRLVFSQSRLPELASDGQLSLLEALADLGDPGDWPALQHWLDPIAGPDRDAVLRVLLLFGRKLLWTAQPQEQLVRECLSAARHRGLEDDLLAALIPPTDAVARWPQAVGLAVNLLNNLAFAGASGGTDAFPRTRQLLAGHPTLACEFIAGFARSRFDALRCLRWLEAASPTAPFRVLAVALGDGRGALDEGAVATLAESGLDCVGALLQAASYSSRLEYVLTGFVRWLATRDLSDVREQRYWQARLKPLSPADPQTRAWLDVALLMVSGSPSALPPPTGRAGYPVYHEAFAEVWGSLRRARNQFDEHLGATCLARYLDLQPWALERAQAASVVDLVRRLVSNKTKSVLDGALAGALVDSPGATRWDFATEWLALARKDDPAVVRDGILASLRGVQPSAEPGQVAALCLRAFREDIPAKAAFAELVKSGVIDSGAFAMAVINELKRAFGASAPGSADAVKWLGRLAAMAARGEFGESVRSEFRDNMSVQARQELWLHLDLFYTTVRATSGGALELTDAERTELTRLSDSIEEVLKKARKPQRSLWRTVVGDGGAPAARHSQ
jgi:hypothetical protein